MTPVDSDTPSLDFYRQLIENLPIGVAYITNEGIVTFFSNTARQYLILGKEEGLGRKAVDFVAEESKTVFNRRIEGIRAGIPPEPTEYILMRSDGSRFEALITTHIQYNSVNALHSFIITIQDIAPQKKIETALKNSEQKFRAMFENSGIPISLCDKNGNLILANKASTKLTGYSENELPGIHFKDITHEDDYAAEKKLFDSLMRGEIESYRIEKRYPDKGGKTAWGWLTVSLIRDGEGNPSFSVRMLEDITDRVLAEKELKESKRKLSTLIGNLPGIVFRVRNDNLWTAEYISEGCYQLTGYRPEDLLENNKISFGELTYPEDLEMLRNEIQKAIKKKEKYRTIYRIITAAGNIKWVLEQGFGILGEDGSVLAIEGFITDISDRMELIEALRESEQKFRLLVENMQDGLYVLDLEGNIIYANERVYSILGIEQRDLIVLSNNRFISKEYRDVVFKERDKILNHMTNSGWIELPAKKASGEGIWLEMRVIPVCNGENQIVSFQNIIRDITERKIAEEKLRASELRFRSYFELPLIGIAILSTELNVLDCNNKISQMLGFPKGKLKERTLYSLIHPEDMPIMEKLNPLINGEVEDYSVTKRLIKQDGSLVYIELALGCIKKPDRSVAFFVGLFNDITEKTLLAEELEHHRNHLEKLVEERTLELAEVNNLLQTEITKQKEAERKVMATLEKEKEVSELKSRFISIASHEFRTPLTTIYSSTQLLERFGRKWDDTMYKNQIDRIKEHVHHLTDTMDDVLIIGKTESGKIKYEPKMVDLKAFCDNLLDDVKPLLTAKHRLVYKFLLKRNIYILDEKLLKYIFLNLLTNAVKYSPHGGKVEFIIKGRRKEIEFVVSDRGIGIPEKNKNILFEPFHRCDNVGDISGTGLGMSIIKRSVNMHKGVLTYESIENKGTTFRILIPRE
jgi:PAS domain S-box-containing protein